VYYLCFGSCELFTVNPSPSPCPDAETATNAAGDTRGAVAKYPYYLARIPFTRAVHRAIEHRCPATIHAAQEKSQEGAKSRNSEDDGIPGNAADACVRVNCQIEERR
jgi:hypothetical protein